MRNILILLAIITLIGISSNYAYSQEVKLATYHENAQLVIDNIITKNTTASITLQSSNIQEIRVIPELEREIRKNEKITSVIVSNENQCLIGIIEQLCIMINMKIDPNDKGITAIQESARKTGDLYIDKINQTFDMDTKFHSSFIHTLDEANQILGTSGMVSGNSTLSAIYTSPMEDTSSMYEKMSAILLPKIIRESGGFYDIAKNLSYENNSKIAFSIIPLDSKSILQLKLSVDYPNQEVLNSKINPLEFFKTDNIHKSNYFSGGFYPLNSIIQIVILSPENISIANINGNIIPTQTIDNEKIPTDVTKDGWIFDPEEGQRIQGKYLLGEKTSVNKEELKFSLSGENIQSEKIKSDESILIVIIISIIAIAVAIFYLKGYKK
jgi:hypothetical protein